MKPLLVCLLLISIKIGVAKENTHSNLSGPAVPREYVLFESDPVRPLAVSHDGRFVFVTNVPDSSVEVFSIHAFGLSHYQSIPVGLEPVAVAVTSDDKELWVVNHLSDSVSIVDLKSYPFHVKQTLLVGDAPRDIVFAGPESKKAFITAAHRGQNLPFDPQLFTSGVGRADVWVYQQNTEDSAERITVITLFGDTPRPLAVSNDLSRVYVGVFKSGSQTTSLPPAAIQGITKPPPLISADGVMQPDSGLIVKFNGVNWVDEWNRNYNHLVGLKLPDYDVFEIDASKPVPEEVKRHSSIGTILYNIEVHPTTNDILISNLESRNHVRFEGKPLGDRTTVRGHIADYQISIIGNDKVSKRDLNKHLDFSKDTGNEDDRNTSLSQPMEMEFDNSGEYVYISAFGSNKVAKVKYSELKDNSFQPSTVEHLELSGGGPAGIVKDKNKNKYYVYTRYDNGVSVIEGDSFTESDHVLMHNPEPVSVVEGRPFLYDARKTSGFGNDSCATCHVFGNNDGLAWDLGNPDGEVLPIPNSYHPLVIFSPFLSFQFHPMKGPMTTQSMRGLVRHGPQHWRGDRTGTQANEGETLEEAAFKEFNVAFDGLMAKPGGISEDEMQKFTDFSMQLTYPPNPNRRIDNTLSEDQQAGKFMYDHGVLRADGNLEICAACHPIDPANGIYGTTGQMSDNSQPGERDFKIPHFRDQYEKIGMFSSWGVWQREEIKGFAFNHNGATSNNALFNEFGISATKVRQLKDFLFAFPTEMPSIVGQQLTINSSNSTEMLQRLDIFINQALINFPVPECDLTASLKQSNRNWLLDRNEGIFVEDRSGNKMTQEEFKTFLNDSEDQVTLTCQPWGSGLRIALDRDEDGVWNQDELYQGSSPIDSRSTEFKPTEGLWYDPEKPGSGFSLNLKGNQLIFAWYTYNEGGSPTWYLASNPIENDWSAELNTFQWNPDLNEAETMNAGSVEIEFVSAKKAQMNWQIGEHTGSISMEHFAFAQAPAHIDFSGLWYNPDQPGWGVGINSQGESMPVVTYYYDKQQQPIWSLAVLNNDTDSEANTRVYKGSCPWCEYKPSILSSEEGMIKLTYDSLNKASIDFYQNDDMGDEIWALNQTDLEKFTN